MATRPTNRLTVRTNHQRTMPISNIHIRAFKTAHIAEGMAGTVEAILTVLTGACLALARAHRMVCRLVEVVERRLHNFRTYHGPQLLVHVAVVQPQKRLAHSLQPRSLLNPNLVQLTPTITHFALPKTFVSKMRVQKMTSGVSSPTSQPPRHHHNPSRASVSL